MRSVLQLHFDLPVNRVHFVHLFLKLLHVQEEGRTVMPILNCVQRIFLFQKTLLL
jgi:hypothetical protein